MTTYSNDPIRVRITLDDIWRLSHPKGIDSTFYPVPETNETEFYCKLVASDLNPHNPEEEKYKEDLEREINKFKIVQDRIREFSVHKHFNPYGNRVIETILDENVFNKENRYDLLLDKAINVHRLKNGQLFGTIETDQI